LRWRSFLFNLHHWRLELLNRLLFFLNHDLLLNFFVLCYSREQFLEHRWANLLLRSLFACDLAIYLNLLLLILGDRHRDYGLLWFWLLYNCRLWHLYAFDGKFTWSNLPHVENRFLFGFPGTSSPHSWHISIPQSPQRLSPDKAFVLTDEFVSTFHFPQARHRGHSLHFELVRLEVDDSAILRFIVDDTRRISSRLAELSKIV
uniref:GPS domain-containing protein n=1 Tax=Haemonchus placei TaxID=6290 RepID=A0A158QRK2_HAEPC